MYRSRFSHKTHRKKTNRLKFALWTPTACDVNKFTFVKLASPQRHRRDAATASSRRFGSVIPYVVRSTIGLLSDSMCMSPKETSPFLFW